MNPMKQALINAKIIPNVICHYCSQPAKLVGGSQIYPTRADLFDLKFWQCKPCGAYVGCHKPTRYNKFDPTVPLGRLADGQLRKAKSAAHLVFDRIWKDGYKTRSEAYAWLAANLNIELGDCHIGEFDVDMCNQVQGVCASYWMAK